MTLPEVKMLGTFNVDAELLVSEVNRLTGFSPVRKMDSVNFNTDKPSGYLAMLSYMQEPDSEERPQELIINSGTLKDHMFQSFLIHASIETIFEITQRTTLKVTSANTNHNSLICVISGTLSEWFVATLEFCSTSSSKELRMLYDKIILLFERYGYGLIWRENRKKSLDDGTFLLL